MSGMWLRVEGRNSCGLESEGRTSERGRDVGRRGICYQISRGVVSVVNGFRVRYFLCCLFQKCKIVPLCEWVGNSYL